MAAPTSRRMRILHALAWVAGALPRGARRRLAAAWAQAAPADGRDYQVVKTNLALIAPVLDGAAAVLTGDAHVRQVLAQSRLTALESLRIWTRPTPVNLRQVRAVHGAQYLDAAIAAGRGVIVAAPHYGNWELLNQWLAARTPLAILYAPPDSGTAEVFLNRVRQRPGVEAIAADASAVRRLLRRLRDGGVVGILPDQQPKRGEGVFAPFFGRPALTMSLLPRLAQRCAAAVVLAVAERRADGDFDIVIAPGPAAIADPDPALGAAALNAAIEQLVRRDPDQYQWTYKRYSVAATGEGHDNPYWPQCYPNRKGSR